MSTEGVTSKTGPLSYSSSSALLRSLTSELKRPILESGSWKESDTPLYGDILDGFWTEHSPRSVMPSAVAVLGVSKPEADYLGRWSPSGSQDYTRTFRVTVKGLQQQVIAAFRKADSRLEESDICDRLRRFGEDREWEACRFELAKTRLETEARLFAEMLRSVQGRAWEEEMSLTLQSLFTEPVSANAPLLVTSRIVAAPRHKKFLLVFSKNKSFVRLHRTRDTACPWVRTQIKDCMELEEVDACMYNSRCKICWPVKGHEECEQESVSSDSD
jgi:hypothetical protein